MTPHHPHFLLDRIMSRYIMASFLENNSKRQTVPVYTMKIFRGSTVTTALICNLSRK